MPLAEVHGGYLESAGVELSRMGEPPEDGPTAPRRRRIKELEERLLHEAACHAFVAWPLKGPM